MKDKFRKLLKQYGLYIVLGSALIISAVVIAFLNKSDNDPVVIFAGSSVVESSESEDSSEKEQTAKETAKVKTTKVTTTKIPRETASKTTKETTVEPSETETEPAEVSFPIDINYVTLDELMAINGIGESTARSILDYRASVGVIRNMEQLLEISGIGESRLALLSEYLYVDDADYSPPTTTTSTAATTTTTATTKPPKTTTTTTTTPTVTVTVTETEPPEPERRSVNINKADAEEIAECLLIDMELAERIVDIREQLGGEYESDLQLLYVKGISKEFLKEIREFIEI